MKNLRLPLKTSVCAFLLAWWVMPAGAVADLVDAGPIEVPREAPFEKEKANFEQRNNLSGLFCPGAHWCVAVSDEERGVHRLRVDRADAGSPRLVHDAVIRIGEPPPDFLAAHGLAGPLKEFDLEAVAGNGEVVLFVGSHAIKRRRGTYNAGAHLVAIVATADLETNTSVEAQWANLDALLGRKDMFGDVFGAQLQCGGVNVEGATILGGRLFIGLRSPHGTDGDLNGAMVVSTPLDGLTKGDFSEAREHFLPTDEPFIGIRAMETVGDRILVVTGDAGTSDLTGGATPQCGANLNREDAGRRFRLRDWTPDAGDRFGDLAIEFEDVTGTDRKGEPVAAKLEAVAADPERPGGLFVLHDGSDRARYLDGVPVR